MTIEAKVICDSIGEKSPRLTTFQLKYPRFIHSEFMTHRVFSRNASSSRAIPVNKMIADIIEDTAMPIHWGKNQPGMQAKEEHNAPVYDKKDLNNLGMPFPRTPEQAWKDVRDKVIEEAKAFHESEYHKQVVNRLLEPFMHISVIATASNFDNFYHLRRHEDAQPEIKALADAMYSAQKASTPALLSEGDWHLPYVTEADREAYSDPQTLLKVSVARCARVSYLTHDGKEPSLEADLKLYDRLVGSEPLHASPAEHQAKVDGFFIYPPNSELDWNNPHLSGNFDKGWIQYRKTLDNEVCNVYNSNE